MMDKKRKREDNYGVQQISNLPPTNQKELKFMVLDLLIREKIKLPIDSFSILRYIKKVFRLVELSVFALSKLKINDVIRELIEAQAIKFEEVIINMKRGYYILAADINKLIMLRNASVSDITTDFDKYKDKAVLMMHDYLKEAHYDIDEDSILQSNNYEYNYFGKKQKTETKNIIKNDQEDLEIDQYLKEILYSQTAKNKINSADKEVTDVFNLKSDSHLSTLEKIKSKYSSTLRPFCKYGTLAECSKKQKGTCQNVHFTPIIKPHTDTSLGDCSYLDTCRHMEICKFVHYSIEDTFFPTNRKELILNSMDGLVESQWINCDIRSFELKILGKFDVIMADPPWDIHMDLPYGTLSDDEMRNLNIKELQDHGVIFLWVTGRATELARECLELWGYERKEELVWIKTNQLQRLIRTGRTGHWLNHSKEHCLIGYKGNPSINRNIDCDVLVSEVRETSRKPDEIDELIERLIPGGRNLELFARPHNRIYGWLSLGNQLPGAYIVEEDMLNRFNDKYLNNKLTKEDMQKNKELSITVKEQN